MSKAHGLKGEIFIRPFNSQAKWPALVTKIVIGSKTFLVDSYSLHKQGMIFKLKSINTKAQALALKGELVFLPKKLFKSPKGEEIYLAELLGFFVYVLNKKIGIVDSFKSSGFQDYLRVKKHGQKKITPIPFVSSYIDKIDFFNKKIFLKLPDHFLDLF